MDVFGVENECYGQNFWRDVFDSSHKLEMSKTFFIVRSSVMTKRMAFLFGDD